MKPIQFTGQTIVLQKPSNMTDEECSPLAILQANDTCISCWQMTLRERIKVLFTGVIWLGVLSGKTQPPVFVEVNRPFKFNPLPSPLQGNEEIEVSPGRWVNASTWPAFNAKKNYNWRIKQ